MQNKLLNQWTGVSGSPSGRYAIHEDDEQHHGPQKTLQWPSGFCWRKILVSELPPVHSWWITTSSRGAHMYFSFSKCRYMFSSLGLKEKMVRVSCLPKALEDLNQIGLKISKLHSIPLKLTCSKPPPSEKKVQPFLPLPCVYLKFFLRSQRAPGWDRPSTSRLGSSVPYAPSVQCDPTLGDFRWVFPVFTICWHSSFRTPKKDVLAIFVCRSPFFIPLKITYKPSASFVYCKSPFLEFELIYIL